MGLDMFLTKKTYVKNWDHYPPEKKTTVSITLGGEKHPTINPEKVSFIIEEAAYWRKFNALHNWFVENCGNGEDDCKEIYISHDDLKNLHEVIKEVSELLENKDENLDRILELLPPTSGFFFGSTEIDEGYESDVNETLDILNEILKDTSDGLLNGNYYYKASW